MNRDWITIIAEAVIIACLISAILIYYNEKHRSCISDPLVYAAESMEEKYGYPFHGTGSFAVGANKQSPVIYFDSEGVKPLEGNYDDFEVVNFSLP